MHNNKVKIAEEFKIFAKQVFCPIKSIIEVIQGLNSNVGYNISSPNIMYNLFLWTNSLLILKSKSWCHRNKYLTYQYYYENKLEKKNIVIRSRLVIKEANSSYFLMFLIFHKHCSKTHSEDSLRNKVSSRNEEALTKVYV